MNRNSLVVGVIVALTCAGSLGSSPVSATTVKKVVISGATVTAARKGHDSAIVMEINNGTSRAILLTSVESPGAGYGMIFFDTNMCKGKQAMTNLANISISGGKIQRLGYRNQGAMLSGLHHAFAIGETVPLTVSWIGFSGAHRTTIDAKVVASPKHIRFNMGNMQM